VDGNKRTATLGAIYLLAMEHALPDPLDQGRLRVALLGEVALTTASGELSVDQIAAWMRRIFAPM